MSDEVIEAIKKIISDKKIILQKDLMSEVQKSGLASRRNAKNILIENEGKFWFTHNLNKNSKYYSLDKELNLSDSELDKIINANFYDFLEKKENEVIFLAIFFDLLKEPKFTYNSISYTKFSSCYHHNVNEFFKNQKITRDQVGIIYSKFLLNFIEIFGAQTNRQIKKVHRENFEFLVKSGCIDNELEIEKYRNLYDKIDDFLKTNTFENFIYPEV